MNKNRLKRIDVLKNSGRSEPFSKKKLMTSLEHTCLPPTNCKAIAEHISHHIGPHVSTKRIFQKTSSLIKKKSLLAAAQYSLKQAIFELGPEGHYFENYVARYFEEIGYQTLERVILQGKFVKHEIDVIAQKNKDRCFIECKFHNHRGIKNDIKTALYVKARWDDLKQGPNGKGLSHFYLATNTSFTSDALTYAKGVGLRLLGVNAPEDRSFFDEIKELKLYPITSLRTLPKIYRPNLLSKNLIVAKDLMDNVNILEQFIKDPDLVARILKEVAKIMGEP